MIAPPAWSVAFAPIVLRSVTLSLASEAASATLIAPPPAPVAAAETTPSPPFAAKPAPPMPTRRCVPDEGAMSTISLCSPTPFAVTFTPSIRKMCGLPPPSEIGFAPPPRVSESWKKVLQVPPQPTT